MNQNLAVKQNFHCYIHKDVYAPPIVFFVLIQTAGTEHRDGLGIPKVGHPGNHRTSFVVYLGAICVST